MTRTESTLGRAHDINLTVGPGVRPDTSIGAQKFPIPGNLVTLREAHPLQANADTSSNRRDVHNTLAGLNAKTALGIGACGMTLDLPGLLQDAQSLRAAADMNPLVQPLLRGVTGKPRTSLDDWHGLDSSHPDEAYSYSVELANTGVPIANEIIHPNQLEVHEGHLSAIWKGARAFNDTYLANGELVKTFALANIPAMIKNGMNGDRESMEMAIEDMKRIKELRNRYADNRDIPAYYQRKFAESAALAMIYRAGSEVKTPEQWREGLLVARELTQEHGFGLVVDTAHGGEIAHHPDNKKSEKGQITCLEHAEKIVGHYGIKLEGLLIEASHTETQTDPTIEMGAGLELAIHVIDAMPKPSNNEV